MASYIIYVQSLTCSNPYQSPAILVHMINRIVRHFHATALTLNFFYFTSTHIHHAYSLISSSEK